ncbi:MAG: hypothetical protein C0404_13770 [Verrucomicrobia bacterium]|nr:hypothetical protein [Verrucomicrobiota bacterium]
MGFAGYGTPPGMMSQAPFTNVVESLIDPWGREYRYVSRTPYSHFRLWSLGRDGIDGTADDIFAESER